MPAASGWSGAGRERGAQRQGQRPVSEEVEDGGCGSVGGASRRDRRQASEAGGKQRRWVRGSGDGGQRRGRR